MLDLPGPMPTTFDELAAKARQAATTQLDVPDGHDPIHIDGGDFPSEGRLMSVNLSGSRLHVIGDGEHLKPPTLVGEVRPGPHFDRFEAEADPLAVIGEQMPPVHVRLLVEGVGMGFGFRETDRGTLAMIPQSGSVAVDASVKSDELSSAIETRARAEAAKQNVKLDAATFKIETPDPRTIHLTGRVEGSKKVAFFNASFAVDVVAEAVVETMDGELFASVRRLDLSGDGAVMSMILAMAKPKIDEIKARPLPLGGLLEVAGVSGMQIRDVQVAADDVLSLHVALGDAAS
jgi:hypothetical protein